MHRFVRLSGVLLAATSLAGGLAAIQPAHAQDASQIRAIQRQIQQLQSQLQQLQKQSVQRDEALHQAQQDAAQARAQAAEAQQKAAAASVPASVAALPPNALVVTQPPGTPGKPNPTVNLGGVSVTLGGFVDLDGIWRSKNETLATGTSFTSIPLKNTANGNTSDFKGSAQQTRLSLLVQGKPTDTSNLAAYFEGDFNASGTSSNNNQSSSYVPRMRVAYAQYDDSAWGLHALAGQSWSLATQTSVGITPRKEASPMTIDTSYLPGFVYLRVPELRVAKDFGGKFWIAAALDEPETLFSGGTATGGAVTGGNDVFYTNPGSGQLASTGTYSIDVAPDMILKAAADPGFGHYEVYGLGRFFKTHVSGATLATAGGSDQVVMGGGIGGATTIPILPHLLDFTGDVLFGYGVGRYGAGQLPDATVKANGSPAPLPEGMGMAGLVAHPAPQLDVYTYAGIEQVARKSGAYGTPTTVVGTGCDIEDVALTCTAQNHRLWEITGGAWYRFLQGSFGTVSAGAQYGFAERDAFSGLTAATHGSTVTPHAGINIVMFDLRYTPFQ